MFACPNGDIFEDAINITREHNDAQYICHALVGYIESVGQLLWTDYKQVENYKTRQALLIHQLVLVC
jgi:hypothetical protein